MRALIVIALILSIGTLIRANTNALHSEADELLKDLVAEVKDSETWIESTEAYKKAKKYVDQINR